MTMKENNQISLSFEMYEDLKDTLVKAIKNTKAGGAGNAGLENAQLERIERLIEAAERSQGQHNCWSTCNGIQPSPK